MEPGSDWDLNRDLNLDLNFDLIQGLLFYLTREQHCLSRLTINRQSKQDGYCFQIQTFGDYPGFHKL
jgi:hypothetical protein